MSAYLLPVAAFVALAFLPRAWWSVGVCFVACTLGIFFSSATNDQVLEKATMTPFLLGNGAFAAGLYHMVRRAMAPDAPRGRVVGATAVVFAACGLTFWLVLQLIDT